MFYKKELWTTEAIIKGIAAIPIWQAHFLITFAVMIGGPMALVGILGSKHDLETVTNGHEMLFAGGLGLVVFFGFFPWPYLVYLAKDLQKTKGRLELLEKKLTALTKEHNEKSN